MILEQSANSVEILETWAKSSIKWFMKPEGLWSINNFHVVFILHTYSITPEDWMIAFRCSLGESHHIQTQGNGNIDPSEILLRQIEIAHTPTDRHKAGRQVHSIKVSLNLVIG